MQEAFSCPPPLPVGAPRSEDASGGEEVGVAPNDLGPQLDSAWWTRTGSSLALSALPGAAPPCAVVNGCSYSATQCFVKALELDPTNVEAWSSLGLTLVKLPPESPVLYHGVAYRSAKQCFLEALRCDPTHSSSWNRLGCTLQPADLSQLNCFELDGRIGRGHVLGLVSDRQIAIGALRSIPCAPARRPSDHPPFSQPTTPLAVRYETERDEGREAEVGVCEVNGVQVTEQQCYLNALRYDERNSSAWVNLGATLDDPFQTVELKGFTLVQPELISRVQPRPEVVSSENSDPATGNKSATAADCTQQQQCFATALSINPCNAMAWFNLGTTLFPADDVDHFLRTSVRKPKSRESLSALVLNGRSFTEADCYVEALGIDLRHTAAWLNLGHSLDPLRSSKKEASLKQCKEDLLKGTMIVLKSGQQVTKQQCYLEALKLQPTLAPAWVGLARTVRDEPTSVDIPISLRFDHGGKTYDKVNQQHCLLRAVLLAPGFPLAWWLLGRSVRRNFDFPTEADFVTIHGRRFTRVDCFVEALQLNAGDYVLWTDLGISLCNAQFRCCPCPSGYVLVPNDPALINGIPYSQGQCFVETLKLEPRCRVAWYNLSFYLREWAFLGGSLPEGANPTVFLNGRYWTEEDCMAEYKRLNPEPQKEHSSWCCIC